VLTQKRRKLDLLRDKIQHLHATLALLLPPGPSPTNDSTSRNTQPTTCSIQGVTPHTATDPVMSFERSLVDEHHGMAMTRENSPDAAGEKQVAGASVLVTEPMGSLYEVTRLRNLRSNQAKVSRTNEEGLGQAEDFISRGVRFAVWGRARLTEDRLLARQRPRSSTTCESDVREKGSSLTALAFTSHSITTYGSASSRSIRA
jgi:hypothetical protein